MPGKKIAYLTSEYPAPSHTFIRREVEALRARGVNIETFSIRRPAANVRFAPADQKAQESTNYLLSVGIMVFVKANLLSAIRNPSAYFATLCRALRHRVPGARALVWSIFHFLEAVVLAEQLKALKIEHLHNHFANSSANVGLLASSFLGIPWSLTLHGTADWDYPAGCLLPEKIQAASFVACVSQFGRAQALGVCPPSQWHKIFVAHCGVDLSVFPPKRRISTAGEPLRILAVGRLSPEKWHLGLLKAFAAVVNQGIDAELRIVGEGPLRESLAKTIVEFGLQHRCVLVGQKTEAEVLEEMAEADHFVQSSLMEGLPVVLIESLGMQLPVVAPCVAGIPELVRDGVTGFLFTAGNCDELATQIKRAARDPELCRTMAHQGNLQVEQQFEIRRAIEPLVERFLHVQPQ